MTKHRAGRLAAFAALALAYAVYGCGHEQEVANEPEPSVAVEARALEIRGFSRLVEAPGRWRASGEFHVVAPYAAIIDSLGPRVGDSVTSGERIGWLVTRESYAALRGAELLLRQAGDAAAREEAARALAFAKRDLTRLPLVAASSGTVSQRSAEPGSEIAEGAEILTLVLEGAMVFEAHVPLAEAHRIATGQHATILMEDGSRLGASVRTRGLATNAADQTALVWLAPSAAAAPELIERFGQASIATGAVRRATAVPDSAIAEDDLTGEHRVVVIDSLGLGVWTTVRLGLAQDGWHELLEPALPAGTRVVVSGQRGLPDSTQVRIGS